MKKAYHIAIEGTIGVGKTSLAEIIGDRLDAKIVLEELAKRVATIEQTGQHSYLRSNFILGIKKLPLKMTSVQE